MFGYICSVRFALNSTRHTSHNDLMIIIFLLSFKQHVRFVLNLFFCIISNCLKKMKMCVYVWFIQLSIWLLWTDLKKWTSKTVFQILIYISVTSIFFWLLVKSSLICQHWAFVFAIKKYFGGYHVVVTRKNHFSLSAILTSFWWHHKSAYLLKSQAQIFNYFLFHLSCGVL